MNYHCVPVGAQWVLQGALPASLPKDHPPLICTMRCVDEWMESAVLYMRRKTPEQVEALYFEHREWVSNLRKEVGYLDVLRGYAGLHRALSIALHPRPLPHLNRSAVAQN